MLCNVLKLATMWEMDKTRSWVIHQLDHAIHPATKHIQLALNSHVDHWVCPALISLLCKKPSTFTLLEIKELGFKTYIIFTRAKEALDDKQKLLAAKAPPLPAPPTTECQSHKRCKQIWKELWMRKINKHLLAADEPVDLIDLPAYIENLDCMEMTPCCKVAVINVIRSDDACQGATITAAVQMLLSSDTSVIL